jgi:uncharacterized protein (TIGR02246 family)
MRPTLTALAASLMLLHWSAAAAPAATTAPETVVQQQMDAYNAHDLEGFLGTYADDAELYAFHGVLQTRGKEEMRKRYQLRFSDTIVFGKVVQRIVMGDTVIDHERVRVTLPEGPGVMEAVVIYQVRDGKIVKVTFISGAKTPGASL